MNTGVVFCPSCDRHVKKHETYVLMFGEIVCRNCDEFTGEFVDWEE